MISQVRSERPVFMAHADLARKKGKERLDKLGPELLREPKMCRDMSPFDIWLRKLMEIANLRLKSTVLGGRHFVAP